MTAYRSFPGLGVGRAEHTQPTNKHSQRKSEPSNNSPFSFFTLGPSPPPPSSGTVRKLTYHREALQGKEKNSPQCDESRTEKGFRRPKISLTKLKKDGREEGKRDIPIVMISLTDFCISCYSITQTVLSKTEPPTPAPTSPPSYLDKLFKGEGKATFVGLEEPREGIETDMSIGDGDLMERNEIDRLEEGAHWDDDRQREVEARRERGRHEQSEYPMTNYFGSATPAAGGGMGGYLRLQVLLPLVVLAQPSCLLLFL
ncbi:hypothetical protein E2C01_007311 [Portunus trituberculatus]|uniref:Uncharacterized protein n=1 Tax=Portunus trituberculatus TaxID=210409 RepID=A0A5B7D3Z9_PORTR|nr:hypothetical protein [Portunus trituberculatus]